MNIEPISNSAVDAESNGISKIDPRDIDRAAAFLAQAHYYVALTPAQERKLKRKIDRWMIPMLLFTATLVWIDLLLPWVTLPSLTTT